MSFEFSSKSESSARDTGASICVDERALFGLISLRSTAFAIAIIDVVLGVLYICETLLLLSLQLLAPRAHSLLTLSLVSNSASMALLPFSALGLVALCVRARCLFRLYFAAKAAEVGFLLLFWTAVASEFCGDGDLQCEAATIVGVCMQKGVFNLACLYYLRRVCTTWSQRLEGLAGAAPNKLSEEGF